MPQVLGALWRWRYVPHAGWVDTLWAATLRRLPQHQPRHLANLLYYCVLMGQAPPRRWLVALLRVAARTMEAGVPAAGAAGSSGEDASAVVVACDSGGSVHSAPEAGPADAAGAPEGPPSGSRGGTWDAQALSTLVYALARLEYAPSPSWLALHHHQSLQMLRCTQRHHASAAASATPFAPHADPPAAGGGGGQAYTALGLERTLWALAQLRSPPSPEWLDAFVEASVPLLARGGFSPRNLVNVAFAMATLRLQPGRAWITALVAAADRHTGTYGAMSLARLVWAAQQLGAVDAARRWGARAAELGEGPDGQLAAGQLLRANMRASRGRRGTAGDVAKPPKAGVQ